MSIWVTGDTHGDWMQRLNKNSFLEQKEMTKDDIVIVCGDFGIWDNSKSEKLHYTELTISAGGKGNCQMKRKCRKGSRTLKNVGIK